MPGLASTRVASASTSVTTLDTTARMAPRSRMCRVSARVSTPLMPITPWATSSSASPRVARQDDARRAGSRTAYPATQIRHDSASSSLTPVLPMCGAVCTTICRW